MNREELTQYIDNCILLGNIVTKEDAIYERLDQCSFNAKNIIDSVFIDGFYVKRDKKDNIHLVYYDGEYEELDLGDCIDIIDDYAFVGRLIHVPGWSAGMYHPERENLVTVVGKSVKYIGERAFALSSVTNINFPNVRKIGVCCFEHAKVESATFNKLKTVKEAVFSGSELKSFEGEEVERVRSLAFQNCKNLTFVSIPKAKTIDHTAFHGCSKLKKENLKIK